MRATGLVVGCIVGAALAALVVAASLALPGQGAFGVYSPSYLTSANQSRDVAQSPGVTQAGLYFASAQSVPSALHSISTQSPVIDIAIFFPVVVGLTVGTLVYWATRPKDLAASDDPAS